MSVFRTAAVSLQANLVPLLIYAGALLIFTYLSADGELELWLIFVGIAMLAHGAISLAVGVIYFIMSKPEWGKATLVSGLVLLVIGFSTCVAVFSGLG